jgi:cell division protein ZapD
MHKSMQTQEIIYQQSPQFLPKVSIRIENLLAYIRESLHEKHPIIHHYALKNVIDLIKIVEKPELKSRYTKEFIRLEYGLSKILPEQAPELWQRFTETSLDLQNRVNRFCSPVFHDQFLQNMRIRIQDNWQECELQTPHLYRWLHQTSRQRKSDLQKWLSSLLEIENIVSVYLNILRFFVHYQEYEVEQNYYHQLIGHHPICQLIVLKIDSEIEAIPKIQVSNNSLSIHFHDPLRVEEISKLHNIPIQLGLSRI